MWIDDYTIVITMMSTFVAISFRSLCPRNHDPRCHRQRSSPPVSNDHNDRCSPIAGTRSSWVQVRLLVHTFRTPTTRPSARIRALIPPLRATGHVLMNVDSQACGSKVDSAVSLWLFLWIATRTWGRNVDRHPASTSAHNTSPSNTSPSNGAACTGRRRRSATMPS